MDIKPIFRESCLLIACQHKNITPSVIKFLLENDADSEITSREKLNPITYLLKNNNVTKKCLRQGIVLLLKQISKLNLSDYLEKNYLSLACTHKNISANVIVLLLCKGANPKAINAIKQKPITLIQTNEGLDESEKFFIEKLLSFKNIEEIKKYLTKQLQKQENILSNTHITIEPSVPYISNISSFPTCIHSSFLKSQESMLTWIARMSYLQKRNHIRDLLQIIEENTASWSDKTDNSFNR